MTFTDTVLTWLESWAQKQESKLAEIQLQNYIRNSDCAWVTYVSPYPRTEDRQCSQKAVVACSACEDTYCAVHSDRCAICRRFYCPACFDYHIHLSLPTSQDLDTVEAEKLIAERTQ